MVLLSHGGKRYKDNRDDVGLNAHNSYNAYVGLNAHNSYNAYVGLNAHDHDFLMPINNFACTVWKPLTHSLHVHVQDHLPSPVLLAVLVMRHCLLSVSARIGITIRNDMAYDVYMYIMECCSAALAMLEVGRKRRVCI